MYNAGDRGERPRRKNAVFAAIVNDAFRGGTLEKAPRCACTKEAWKERGIFTAKNIIVLGAGLAISSIIRAILSASKKNDPRILGKSDGAMLSITDVAGCALTLILCSAWVRPSPTHFTDIIRSPKLLTRSVVRNAIPLFSALLVMFLVKLIDYKINGPDHVIQDSNNNRIVEASDFVGGFLLLATFHILDRILERCWPANVDQDRNFGERMPLKKGINGQSQLWGTGARSARGNTDAEINVGMSRQAGELSDEGYLSGTSSTGFYN